MPLCDSCHPKAHGKNGHWNTSELTKRAIEVRRKAGRFTGGNIPYGYQLDEQKQLLPQAPEILVRHLIKAWRRGGAKLLHICADLERLRFPPNLGGEWKEATIRKICKSDL